MGYAELSERIKPIIERRPIVAKDPNLLTNIGFEWERKKYTGQVKDIEQENPLKYIKGDFSAYLAHAVYSYVWEAMINKLKIIRLGSANVRVDERLDSLDDFSEIGEAMVPYFLEAVRYDEILRRHLEISQIGPTLVVKINA